MNLQSRQEGRINKLESENKLGAILGGANFQILRSEMFQLSWTEMNITLLIRKRSAR